MLAIVLRVNRPHTEKSSPVAPQSVEHSLSLSTETLGAVRAANADDAQLQPLAYRRMIRCERRRPPLRTEP